MNKEQGMKHLVQTMKDKSKHKCTVDFAEIFSNS